MAMLALMELVHQNVHQDAVINVEKIALVTAAVNVIRVAATLVKEHAQNNAKTIVR